MAVELGDHSSGFCHGEVIRFINNEILMNGGGPEFYMAFRMRPWNEIEDQLRTILADPQVPRPLKRACTWSALALSVRIAARQREQQAYMVGLPQDAMGQRPSAPRASVSELWQLRQQKEEAVAQVLSTQAALQQAMRECDLLRRRLHHAERSAQMAPMVQDIVPGAQAQQLGASVVPLNPDNTRVMGTVGGYDRQYLEAQMSAGANVFYMPGSTSPWPLAMQPSVPVPVPYQFPPHPPFLMGSPLLMPFSSPVVMETEAGVVVPVQVPPGHPSGPLAAPCSQDSAGVWDQRCYMAAEGPPVIQRAVPPGDVRDSNQVRAPEKRQEGNTLGDIGSRLQRQGPQGTQEKATLEGIENDSEEGEENDDDDDDDEYDDENDADDDDDGDDDDYDEEAEVTAPRAVAKVASAAKETTEEETEDSDDDDIGSLQSLHELHLREEDEFHSQSENSPQASARAPLGSSRSRTKEEGVEEAQATPVWESWSQAVRESPKKQQPQLPKKDNKPPVEAASESQPVARSRMNWVCLRCKAMNFSWRKVCYKCKRVCMPLGCGGYTH